MSDEDAMARETADLSGRLKSLLAGRDPAVQGAVLADLLSIWLAGHIVPGDTAGTDALRAGLLDMHIACVRELVPASEKEVLH